MESDGFTGSIIILAVILIKAFFTASEAAVTEISDSRVRSFENGTKNQRRLWKLLNKPAELITAFSVNRILSAVMIAYLALFSYISPLSNGLHTLFYGGDIADKEMAGVAPVVIAVLIILLLTVLVLTAFCDGLPKKFVGSDNAEKFALFCAVPVRLLVMIFTPMTALSNLLVNFSARLFGSGNNDGNDIVTEEEILMMVDAGNETGVIEESQKEMINNIFEFNDLTASDVMTHRTDVVGVEDDSDISEVVNAAISSGFSRIPVYENSMDHIIGIICVKDLLCMVGSDAAASAAAKDFVREVIYVPETISCVELFKRLSDKHMQLAVVADEYGGTAGIVTMEDVVEAIVGNIQDEYDDETEELIKISEDTYTIDGTAEPEHILGEFGITLPEDNNFDTMSGFIVSLLGRIPEENENPAVEYENVLFTVLITEDMCITKLKATILNDDKINDINLKEKREDDECEKKD